MDESVAREEERQKMGGEWRTSALRWREVAPRRGRIGKGAADEREDGGAESGGDAKKKGGGVRKSAAGRLGVDGEQRPTDLNLKWQVAILGT